MEDGCVKKFIIIFLCAVGAFVGGIASAQTAAKDADGNMLPRFALSLLNRESPNTLPPDRLYGSEWTVQSSWGRSGLYLSHFDINDLESRRGKVFVSVVRKFSEKDSITTDLLLLKRRSEITAWGQSCNVHESEVPSGYLIGAVLDKRDKKRLNGKDGCDAPSYPAKRAYLLNTETGKLQSYQTKKFWCVNEDELPCGS
jgi:hypothetical protein